MWTMLVGVALGADAWVTIQGDITDGGGTPLEGSHSVTFSVWADEVSTTPLFTQQIPVVVTHGAFSAALGEGETADDTLWNTTAARFLSVEVGGVDSARTPVGWTARAWYADRAGHLGDYTPEQVVVDGEAIPWAAVQAGVTPNLPGASDFRAAVESDPSVNLSGSLSATNGFTAGGGSFSGALAANGGLSGTTGAFSGALSSGPFSATTGAFSGLLTASGGLSGGTGSFSGALAANGGLTGTTGAFSGALAANGGLTGTTGAFSGALAANGGLTGTTGTYSGLLTGNGGLSATTGRFTGNDGVGTPTPQATLDVNGGVRVGAVTTCGSTSAGTLRYVAANGTIELCNGSAWAPLQGAYYRSCKELRDAGTLIDGWNTIDLDGPGSGAPFSVWCDQSTDGGGWTLGVNFTSDLGAVDLSSYAVDSATPTTANYGVNMNRFARTTATEYRLGCVESADNASRKLFLRGLVAAEPIFTAAGVVSTKASVQCASSPSFSDAVTGAGCWGSDDTVHTYYTHSGADINWALFNGGAAYTLRHCRPVGTGYFNRGAIWFR
jgi:hypothetical protein